MLKSLFSINTVFKWVNKALSSYTLYQIFYMFKEYTLDLLKSCIILVTVLHNL